MNNKGIFVVIEGQDGCGKSTQVKLLKERLERDGRDVITTREPGGTPDAEAVRQLLVTGEKDRWDKISEIFLFSAARRNHVEKLIKPAIAEGKIVISDRFVSSTMAYQGFGHGLDLKLIDRVTNIAIGSFKPDVTFFLTVDPEIGVRRALSRRGTEIRFEQQDMEFYKRVRLGYDYICKQHKLIGDVVSELDTTPMKNESDEECIQRVHQDIYHGCKLFTENEDLLTQLKLKYP